MACSRGGGGLEIEGLAKCMLGLLLLHGVQIEREGGAQPNARQAEVVPLSFGSVVSPGPFALLAQKLKDFRKDRCKESL